MPRRMTSHSCTRQYLEHNEGRSNYIQLTPLVYIARPWPIYSRPRRMVCQSSKRHLQTDATPKFAQTQIININPRRSRCCPHGRERLSFLNKQEMHSSICDDDKGSGDDREANDVEPVSLGIKAKSAQDGCARNLNVEAVLMVDQSKEGDLVDNESLEAIVENRQLKMCQWRTSFFDHGQTYALQPESRLRNGIVV